MKLSGLAISMGLGVAVGAVAVMMLPHQSTVRKLANKAADKVEDATWMVTDRIQQAMDL